VLQDTARPQPGGDRVAAVDADLPAFQILRCVDADIGVVEQGAVVKRPHRKDRDRRERLAMGARAEVRRHRHLADVELQAANHAAEGVDDGGHVLEVELELARLHGPVAEGLRMAAPDESSLEPGS